MMLKKIVSTTLLLSMAATLFPQTSFGISLFSWPDPYHPLPDSTLLQNWGFPRTGAGLYDLSQVTDRSNIFAPVAPSETRPDTSSLLRKKFTAAFDTSDITCTLDEWGYSYCGLLANPNPTEQDTEIVPYEAPPTKQFVLGKGYVAVAAATHYYAKQTFTHANTAQLKEAQQDVQVTYLGPTEVKFAAPSSVTQETYATIYERYADIVAVHLGDLTKNIPSKLCTAIYDEGALIATDCPFPLYKDGKTYFMRWITGWTWTKAGLTSEQSSGEGGAYPPILPASVVQNSQSPIGVKTSFTTATSTPTFITRPLNDDILHITTPQCRSGEKRGAIKTKAWTSCITYGLSADGRTGIANYYTSKSSWGGYLTPLLILLDPLGALLFITSLDLVFPGAGIALTAAAIDDALTGPTLQSAALVSSVALTVRTSDTLGVGTWVWSDGFSGFSPSVSIKANNTYPTLAVAVPDTAVTLAWSSRYAQPGSCTASGSWTGAKTDSGTLALGNLLRGTSTPGSGKMYDYAFACNALAPSVSSTTDNVKVTVWQYPVCSKFIASPSSIDPGASSQLEWACDYATSCSIDNGIGNVNRFRGIKQVTPKTTTIYTLSCDGLDGSRAFRTTIGINGESPVPPISTTTATSAPRIKEELPR